MAGAVVEGSAVAGAAAHDSAAARAVVEGIAVATVAPHQSAAAGAAVEAIGVPRSLLRRELLRSSTEARAEKTTRDI